MANPEFRGYNDYMVEVYSDDDKIATFLYVSNTWFLCLWLNIRYPKWTSIKVFHRLSEIFIGEYARDGDIPAKPR